MATWILSLRWLMLIASIGTGVGSLMMFWAGATRLWSGMAAALAGGADQKSMVVAVMGATDAFIFGVVLLIFSLAVAFGFVFELSEQVEARLPNWIRLGGISDFKRVLMEVIVLYLTVDFATDLANGQGHAAWPTLVMPLAILLLAGALRLLREPHA